MSGELETALVRAHDRLGLFGGRVRVFDEVGSTNDIALEWADAGGEEGLTAVADSQTQGRGRLGRHWSSPPGAGVYASVLLRPPPDVMLTLTLAAGVAIADGITAATGWRPALKWPNDVCVIDGDGRIRKLAGILAEGGIARDGLRHVIIGFGLNVTPASHPPDVAARATSLEAELGRAVDRAALIVECLAALSHRYEQMKREGSARVRADWERCAQLTLGRTVEWTSEGTTVRGIADTIDQSGALVIRTADGHRRVIAGEVRWI